MKNRTEDWGIKTALNAGRDFRGEKPDASKENEQANAKLTDDEERASGVRTGTCGQPRSSSFGPASCSTSNSKTKEPFLLRRRWRCLPLQCLPSNSDGPSGVYQSTRCGPTQWSSGALCLNSHRENLAARQFNDDEFRAKRCRLE